MIESLNHNDSEKALFLQSKIKTEFNWLLDMLRDYIGVKGSISSLERWLISPGWNSAYRDYFKKNHSKMRDELEMNDAFSVTKINLSTWKHIILSTTYQPSIWVKNVVFLDKIKENLNTSLNTILDNKMREIHFLERDLIEEKNNISVNISKEIFETIS